MPQSASFDMDLNHLSIRELLEYFLRTRDPDAWQKFEHRVHPFIEGIFLKRLYSPFQADARQGLVNGLLERLIEDDYRLLRNFVWPDDEAIYSFLRGLARDMAIEWEGCNYKPPQAGGPIRELLEYFLRTGDPDAWKELERKIRPVIEANIFRLLRSPSLAETRKDLINDLFIKLFEDDRLRNLAWTHEDAIYRYLKVMARNLAIDWIRKNRKFDQTSGLSPEVLNLGDGTNYPKKAEARIVLAKIDKYLLSRKSKPDYVRDRNIFMLFYRWGYTDKAIAALPSINLSTKKVENIRRQLVVEVKRELKW